MPRRIAPFLARALVGVALDTVSGRVVAADIKVLTTGAMRGVLADLLPQFEADTGNKVSVDNATAGAVARRIEEGEAFDLAIVTPKAIDDLAAKGRIVSGSR